jgi:hypothetical protein
MNYTKQTFVRKAGMNFTTVVVVTTFVVVTTVIVVVVQFFAALVLQSCLLNQTGAGNRSFSSIPLQPPIDAAPFVSEAFFIGEDFDHFMPVLKRS